MNTKLILGLWHSELFFVAQEYTQVLEGKIIHNK